MSIINNCRVYKIFCMIMVFAAAGYSLDPMPTAFVPVKIVNDNVGAVVAITPPAGAAGQRGDTNTVAAGQTETFTLRLAGYSSVTHGGRTAANAPASIARRHGAVSLALRSEIFGNAQVSLFSINGKKIMQGNASEKSTARISRQNLAEGVYLLSVKGDKGNTFASKIVHKGGKLDISITTAQGATRLAKQTADGNGGDDHGYGRWTVTAVPTSNTHKTKTFEFAPNVNDNDLIEITLEAEDGGVEPDPCANGATDACCESDPDFEGCQTVEPMTCSPTTRSWDKEIYATRGTNNLVMNIKLPNSGNGPWPIVMYIHGGVWNGTNGQPGSAGALSGISRTKPYALAEITYTYANSSPPSYPASVEDVLAAIRYLRANAAKYCIDPNKIIAAGHSSGGYFANMAGALSASDNHTFTNTSLGNAEVSSKVQAWVAACGLTDLSKLFEQDGNQMHCTFNQNFMGFNICQANESQVETLRKSNPLEYITTTSCAALPPTYLLHGTNDTTVPVGQADILKAKIDSQCSDHNVEYVRTGRGHESPTPQEASAIFNWLDGIFYK